MKFGMLKKSVPLPIILVISMLAVSGIAGVYFLSTRDITSSMTILATYGVGIWESDGTTALMNIVFGDFYIGEASIFPGNLPGEEYYIENTGEDEVYVYFSMTGITGVDIKLQQDIDGDGTFINWANSAWLMDGGSEYAVQPGESVAFRVSVNVNGTPGFGTHNPVLSITASDTPDLTEP